MMSMSRHQQGEGQPGWLALTSVISACSSVSAFSLPGGLGCPCDGCAPACKNTDFGGPPWSHSQWAAFDQNNRNHPQSLDNRFSLGIGSKFTPVPYRWILLKMKLSMGTCWIKHFPIKAALSSPSLFETEKKRKYTLDRKKKYRKWHEKVPGCVIKVRTSWALACFSISPKLGVDFSNTLQLCCA